VGNFVDVRAGKGSGEYEYVGGNTNSDKRFHNALFIKYFYTVI
jgi:hypothetical protein